MIFYWNDEFLMMFLDCISWEEERFSCVSLLLKIFLGFGGDRNAQLGSFLVWRVV